MKLRLMAYTRYGPMVGCLACGTSRIVKAQEKTAPPAGRRASQ